MFFVFYFSLIVLAVCESNSQVVTTGPNVTTTVKLNNTLPSVTTKTPEVIEVTTRKVTKTPTVITTTLGTRDLIEEEERKIARLKLQNTQISFEIINTENDCQREIEAYEKKFNIKQNYSEELRIQHIAVQRFTNMSLKVEQEENVLKKVNGDIRKHTFINLLLVQDINLLLKRRAQNYSAICKSYQKKNIELQQRSLADLMKMISRSHKNPLLERLYRLRNISKDLTDERSFLNDQLEFAKLRCREEKFIVETPIQSMNKTIDQLKENTETINNLTVNLKQSYTALVEELYDRNSHLHKLTEYNRLLQKNLKRFQRDIKCYSDLENEVL